VVTYLHKEVGEELARCLPMELPMGFIRLLRPKYASTRNVGPFTVAIWPPLSRPLV